MSKLKQFFFNPQGKDRLWWSWIDGVFAIFFLVMTLLTYHKFGRWHWVCTMDSFFFTFNLVMCWAQGALYEDWKKKQPPA